jgi:hypothetical protein
MLPVGALGNGLAATDWFPIHDAPLPVAQSLLVALRSAQIPAYAIAEVNESPYRGLATRSPLAHRIYVDRSHRDQARSVVQEELRSHREIDARESTSEMDTEFAELMAQLTPGPLMEEESGFVPPIPELSFSSDPITRAAWAGVIGGPALLLLNVFGFFVFDGLAPALALIAFVAGFTTLVVRMPDRPPQDDGPDDGAIV